MTMNITSHGEKIATINPTTSGDAPDFELTDLKSGASPLIVGFSVAIFSP